MNLYGFLLKRLPAAVAQMLMVVWYLLLIFIVFRTFSMPPDEFRYIAL